MADLFELSVGLIVEVVGLLVGFPSENGVVLVVDGRALG